MKRIPKLLLTDLQRYLRYHVDHDIQWVTKMGSFISYKKDPLSPKLVSEQSHSMSCKFTVYSHILFV